MKLTPGKAVRWETEGAHHVGRVMMAGGGFYTVTATCCTTHPHGEDMTLIRHWPTGDLEFVPWSKLIERPDRED